MARRWPMATRSRTCCLAPPRRSESSRRSSRSTRRSTSSRSTSTRSGTVSRGSACTTRTIACRSSGRCVVSVDVPSEDHADLQGSISWDDTVQAVRAARGDRAIDVGPFVGATAATPALPALDHLVDDIFQPGRPLIDVVRGLSSTNPRRVPVRCRVQRRVDPDRSSHRSSTRCVPGLRPSRAGLPAITGAGRQVREWLHRDHPAAGRAQAHRQRRVACMGQRVVALDRAGSTSIPPTTRCHRSVTSPSPGAATTSTSHRCAVWSSGHARIRPWTSASM